MAKIGDITEIPGETIFEWKIKDFFTQCDEKVTYYDSPTFYYSGASWDMRLFPNDHTKDKAEVWISLHLIRMSSGTSVNVEYSLGLQIAPESTLSVQHFKSKFRGKGYRAYIPHFIKRAEVMEKKTELDSLNDLTVICTMKNSEPTVVSRSLFRRLQDISDNLCEIYLKKKRPDFRFKFNKKIIPASRMILETRSPVFEAMLKHDTRENQTGEVSIDDIDIQIMHSLLLFIYSGEMDILKQEKVLSLYAAADKYDIKDVKEICLEFIIENLSVEWLLDVLLFADLYQEEGVSRRAKEYFRENADEILGTENWKTFANVNPDLSVELLGSLVETLLPLRKSSNK